MMTKSQKEVNGEKKHNKSTVIKIVFTSKKCQTVVQNVTGTSFSSLVHQEIKFSLTISAVTLDLI